MNTFASYIRTPCLGEALNCVSVTAIVLAILILLLLQAEEQLPAIPAQLSHHMFSILGFNTFLS